MGEAKRRGQAANKDEPDLETGFNAAERESLARVRVGAYRNAGAALSRARAATSGPQQLAEIGAIHLEAARVLVA